MSKTTTEEAERSGASFVLAFAGSFRLAFHTARLVAQETILPSGNGGRRYNSEN